MNAALVSIFSVLVFMIILFCIIVLYSLKKKNPLTMEKAVAKKLVNLDQLLNDIANPKLNSDEIQKIILKFIDSQTLPSKFGKNLSADAKKKLNFVTAVAVHQNSSAKNIAFLNRELSKRYQSYTKDILAYEQMGLAKRNIIEARSKL